MVQGEVAVIAQSYYYDSITLTNYLCLFCRDEVIKYVIEAQSQWAEPMAGNWERNPFVNAQFNWADGDDNVPGSVVPEENLYFVDRLIQDND